MDYWEAPALVYLMYDHVFDSSAWQLWDRLTNGFDFSTD